MPPQMTDIVIKDGKVSSNNPAVQVDLGGYAKGYALDMPWSACVSKALKMRWLILVAILLR